MSSKGESDAMGTEIDVSEFGLAIQKTVRKGSSNATVHQIELNKDSLSCNLAHRRIAIRCIFSEISSERCARNLKLLQVLVPEYVFQNVIQSTLTQ